MPTGWTARDVNQMIATGTACLCLIILILGVVIAVVNGKISVEILGKVEGAGAGGGLLGFGVILQRIIKASVPGDSAQVRRKGSPNRQVDKKLREKNGPESH